MSLNCNFCYSEIESNVIKCPECNLPYHDDCWKKNKSKCTEYNCKGTTKEPENSEKETLTENTQPENKTQPLNDSPLPENKVIKASNQKIVFVLVGIIGILVLYILYSTNVKQPIQEANNTSSNITSSYTYSPTPNSTPLPSIEQTQIQETSQPTEEPTVAPNITYSSEEISSILNNWKSSWESKDIDAYSSFYSKYDFSGYRSSNGELEGPIEYEKWVTLKKELFNRYKEISVGIELLDYQVDNENSTIKVYFRQKFTGLSENSSNSYSDSSKKLIVLKFDDNKNTLIINEKPI